MAIDLSGSVGRLGLNKPGDVRSIQTALNAIPADAGRASPLLEVDGICGTRTLEAIQRFQVRHFGWKGADARVDVGGPSHQKLNELLPSSVPGASGFMPVSDTGAPRTSESFSFQINTMFNEMKSIGAAWEMKINDEANQVSEVFKMEQLFGGYMLDPGFMWSRRCYFKTQMPVALSDFDGARFNLASILSYSPSDDYVFGPNFRGERWDGYLALGLTNGSNVVCPKNVPFKITECWEAKTAENPKQHKIYTREMKGNLKWRRFANATQPVEVVLPPFIG